MRFVVVELCWFERQRHPQLHGKTIVHSLRKHTDDLVRLTIHADVFTDDVGVRRKVPGPHSVAEYYDAVSARLTFFRKKVAPEHHRQPFHLEEPGRAR